MLIKLIFCLLVFLILSCSSETESYTKGKVSEENAFKEYSNALDKAKEVENIIQDAAKQRAKEIDSHGG